MNGLLDWLWLADWSIKTEAQIKCVCILLDRLLDKSLLDRLLNDRLLDLRNRLTAKNIIVHDVLIVLRLIVTCGDGLLFGCGFGPGLDKFFGNTLKGFLVLDDHLFFCFPGVLIQGLSNSGSSGLFGHGGGGNLIFILVKRGLSRPIISINSQPAIIVDTSAADPSRLVGLVVNTAILGATDTANALLAAEPAIVAATHHPAHAFSNGLGLDSLFFKKFLVA